MRKSQSITLTLMAGLAAACSDAPARQPPPQQQVASSGEFGAPEPDETRHCVDEQNRVVSDDECTRPRTGGFYPYFFYFGGRTLMSGSAAYVSGGRRATVGGIAGAAQGGRGAVSRGGLGARSAGRGGAVGG